MNGDDDSKDENDDEAPAEGEVEKNHSKKVIDVGINRVFEWNEFVKSVKFKPIP